jgi:4-hydroxy-tetrahydrodipicolinate reductase
MVSPLRVVSFGLGPIGLATARFAASRRTIQLVGAIDVDPAKAGRDVGELLERAPLGIRVEADAEAALRRLAPDAVLHCTSSFLPVVQQQLLLACRHGADVVSSSEELLFAAHQHPELARELDAAARAAGVTVVGTGVNPGFAMDYVAVIASAACFDVRAVRCTRVVDAGTRRLPLQRKVGAGLTTAEFMEQQATGRFGHIGMRESVALLGAALGLELDSITQSLEPMVATEERRTPFLTVARGQVAGIRNRGFGRCAGRTVIELDLSMYVGAPDPRDEVVLDGEPSLRLQFPGGIPGDQATAAILVNTLHQAAAAAPGLKTVLDLAPPRLAR